MLIYFKDIINNIFTAILGFYIKLTIMNKNIYILFIKNKS